MASQKQIAANRKNAAKSTGPRTQQGKARSKMNALCHGFSKGTSAPRANSTTDSRAELEQNVNTLQSIRAARAKLLAELLHVANPQSHSKLLGKIASLQRYEARAYMARKKLLADYESS